MLKSNAVQKEYWEGTEEKFFRRCHRYIEGPNHPVFKAISGVTIEQIRKQIIIDKEYKILDVGCGSGNLTLPLSRIASGVFGLDFSYFMLKKNPCLNLVHADATAIPFKDKSFDLVLCSDILHHISNPFFAVEEMARISRKYVVIIEPNRYNLGNFVDALITREERHILRSSKFFLSRMVKAVGLKIICGYCYGMVFPNITPLWAIGILKRIKRFPFLGRQILLIAYK